MLCQSELSARKANSCVVGLSSVSHASQVHDNFFKHMHKCPAPTRTRYHTGTQNDDTHLRRPCKVPSSCFSKASSNTDCARHALAPYFTSSSRLVMRFSWCSSCACALFAAATQAAWSFFLFCYRVTFKSRSGAVESNQHKVSVGRWCCREARTTCAVQPGT